MKRKLLLLNALLAGTLILGAAELYKRVLEADARFSRLEKYAGEAPAPDYPAAAAAAALRPAAYMPIVDRLLFVKDRNPIVEVVVAEPVVEQRPALPLYSGLVDFGDGPLALMAPSNASDPAWIGIGEKVGDFTFQGLAEDGRVKLAWKDQQIVVAQDELTGEGGQPEPGQPKKANNRRTPPKPGQPATPPPNANMTQPAPQTVGGQYNIGKELRPGVFAADPKDSTPDGTEFKGYVKRVRKTPFGSQSWWETKQK
ncbi:MAG: hypothetical protein GC160_11135 [Acidobacteria bacterium]|nr:hypothetical protein [Acidobacteriota bacterium]